MMTTPNLDAIGHQWVTVLAGYNMTIEYLKGADNKIADILSRVPQRLSPEAVTVLLNHAWTSDFPQAEADKPLSDGGTSEDQRGSYPPGSSDG